MKNRIDLMDEDSKFVNQIIINIYFSKHRMSVRNLYTMLIDEIQKANQLRQEQDKLRIPSLSYRRISALQYPMGNKSFFKRRHPSE